MCVNCMMKLKPPALNEKYESGPKTAEAWEFSVFAENSWSRGPRSRAGPVLVGRCPSHSGEALSKILG